MTSPEAASPLPRESDEVCGAKPTGVGLDGHRRVRFGLPCDPRGAPAAPQRWTRGACSMGCTA